VLNNPFTDVRKGFRKSNPEAFFHKKVNNLKYLSLTTNIEK